MEETSKKTRKRVALMIVRENEDGAISSRHIGPTLCKFILIVLFVLFVFFLCYFIYSRVTMSRLRTELYEQLALVNNLTDENESLATENNTLSSKVNVLSETVTKKAASEEALDKVETENAIPKGFPLSGTATMGSAAEELDGKPILKFSANSGVNIVSSGTGTILSVEEDADYGHRIIIDHGNGYKSIYRNPGEVLVKEGDTLGKGYILFSIGNDNKELGYQITYNDEYVDPTTVLEIDG